MQVCCKTIKRYCDVSLTNHFLRDGNGKWIGRRYTYVWQVGDAIFIVRLHRSSARLSKRRGALHNAPLCSAARARARAHANRWIVAKRCVLRSTSGKLLRLLFSPQPCFLSLFLAPVPPSRFLSPSLADRPENGPWLRGLVFTPRRFYSSPRSLA